MFQCQAVAAGFLEDAHAGGIHLQPVAQGGFEGLHVDLSDVIMHPLLEDLDQEAPKLFGMHRSVGSLVPLLDQVEAIRIHPFNDRDELDPFRLCLVTQEAVHLFGLVGSQVVDGHQDIVLHAVLLQHAQAAYDLVESRRSAFVDAVGVVQLARTIDADADQEVVFFEELAPLVVQQRTVGLHGVLKSHAWFAILLLVLDGFAVEIDPHQGRFASLPGHRDLVAAVGLDQLADIGFEGLFRHAEFAIGIEQLLVQEEAVRTGQVASRPAGLGEDVYSGGDGFIQ